jgi:hypothetical protein
LPCELRTLSISQALPRPPAAEQATLSSPTNTAAAAGWHDVARTWFLQTEQFMRTHYTSPLFKLHPVIVHAARAHTHTHTHTHVPAAWNDTESPLPTHSHSTIQVTAVRAQTEDTRIFSATAALMRHHEFVREGLMPQPPLSHSPGHNRPENLLSRSF